MKIIFDTSAFIPENKPEKERKAILELTKLLPDLDITIYVSKKIIKEYGSKLRLFPGRFREFFGKVILKAKVQRTCKDLSFGNLRIHRIEPKINLDDRFRNMVESRCKEYDPEDEKFLELFIHLGKRDDVYLVTAAEDLACMAKEAKRFFNLKGLVRDSVYVFLVEIHQSEIEDRGNILK